MCLVPFNPLTDLPPRVNLNFFASFMFGLPGFPLSEIPLQKIIENVELGKYRANPSRIFRFEEIKEAHKLMESNKARGKIVVVV